MTSTLARRLLPALTALALVAACASEPPPDRAALATGTSPEAAAMYGPIVDGERIIPAIPPQYLVERNIRREVDYWSGEPPGTIVVDPFARYLYLVEPGFRATRYAVAVGREGRGFSGDAVIPIKREWPRWIPTKDMIAEDPAQYGPWAEGMEGGLSNPLGARALYLHRDGRDTYYRIHGTSEPSSIGNATSAGCIRLFNQDIVHLYNRVAPGTRVVVLTAAESGLGTVPPGGALPPLATGPATIAPPGETAATMFFGAAL
ncbi:L,D-transpeptidase [Cereibacter sphaeroides]|uniref:L,D-transpeptidase n=1 Tax=Cereibacter sphaeroides TaxID=1063 RepID=UPI001F3CA6A8|nr:L,D-transpeptidase [Cereibacter sphaeroides]MCE6961213.1 L,D-transpeptidase [Cereibacter sphaeroides]MCE6970199.1 L,D-transpeptidase [Cereibacter sphaeroides]MCE6974062.1 L,D-transpeptidase [Cereibacter sphaeroides]